MLKGSLEGFGLPDLFRLMSQSKKTGRLDVTRSAGRGQVYFREGTVYYATSSLSTVPLGRRLVDLGALTERRLAEALDQHALTGERVGDILLQSGAVSEDQLEAAVRLQIEDSVFDLMRWDRGEFSWQPGVAIATEVPVAFRVEELVVEASRRIDELDLIKAKIPSPDAVLTLSAEAPGAQARVSMTPAEWKVLVLVDGHRTVGEIAEAAGLEVEVAMQMLHGLTSAGLIELAHDGRTRQLRQGAPSTPAPNRLTGLLDDRPRPSYDLVGGPGAASDEDEADFLFRPPSQSAEEPSADPLEPILEDSGEWPTGPSSQAIDDWLSESDTTFEGFDLPAPGELVTEEPAAGAPAGSTTRGDDHEGEARSDDRADSAAPDLLGVPEPGAENNGPGVLPGEEKPADLIGEGDAGLGDGANEPAPQETNGLLTSAPSEGAETLLASEPTPDELADGVERKRVEDDERVTRGLINRLIEGLKGL